MNPKIHPIHFSLCRKTTQICRDRDGIAKLLVLFVLTSAPIALACMHCIIGKSKFFEYEIICLSSIISHQWITNKSRVLILE